MKRLFALLSLMVAVLFVGCNNDDKSVTPSIVLSQNSVEAWFDADVYEVKVNANCAWVATTDCNWITLVDAEGLADYNSLKFSVAKNESSEVRSANIVVSAKGYEDVFEVVAVSQGTLLDEYFELTYTSTDNDVVIPYDANVFGANIVSNTYENGVGTILFDAPVTKVGECAFCDCTTLQSITLPDSVTELGGWAFFACAYMKQVTLSNRLKTIGDAAFSSCAVLHDITLPESLTTVGDSAFYGCSGMSGYYGKFASEDNRCLIVDDVLRHYAPKGLDEYTIPDGVVTIAHDAFYESFRLKNVTIPLSVTTIEEYAFYYCEALKKVYCKPQTPPTLGESVFENSDDGVDKPIGCKIYVPEKSVDAYKEAKNWSRYKSYIYGDAEY